MAKRESGTSNVETLNSNDQTQEAAIMEAQTQIIEVPKPIIQICDAMITRLNETTQLEGQLNTIEIAKTVIMEIRSGARFEQITRHFQSWIPGGFSGGGAWLDSTLQRHIGRVVDEPIVVARIAGGVKPGDRKVYVNLAIYEIENDKKVSQEFKRFVGAEVKCFRCRRVYAAKEIAHQLRCPDCDLKVAPKKGATGGIRLTKMSSEQQELWNFAKAAFSKRNDPKFRSAIIQGLNSKRAAVGLGSLEESDLVSAASFEVLMS